MTQRDDDIEFDFFEEPQTQDAPERERAPKRPGGGRGPRGPRQPIRPPAGVTPLLRLVGLIAFAILIIVLLVFWVQSCQSDRKREAYKTYVADIGRIAKDSDTIGRNLNDLLTTPGIKQTDLEKRLAGLVQQQELGVAKAQKLSPPGPLRTAHQNAVEALQFRVGGLRGLEDTFASTRDSNDATTAGGLLAAQAQRLVASDVVWDDLFKEAAVAELKKQDIGGVEVPDSNFVQTPDLASTRSMVLIFQRIHGAATGGTPTGSHGNGIASVKVLPENTVLSESTETTILATTDLAFAVAVTDTGDAQEVNVVVTLTINQSPEPIVTKQTIDIINPGETKTVVFRDIPAPSFGEKVKLRVDVAPVLGEKNTVNNTKEYPVFFSVGG